MNWTAKELNCSLTNALLSKLLKEEDRLCVVSIYGVGGLGKTTLAKEVYNHRDVKSHFDCYAWTTISQQLSTREVLKEILRKVSTLTSKDMGEMEGAELVGRLSTILNGKRYLVVLDDIWSTEAWDILKPAFPNNKGSKPRSLTDNEAWELLCMKVLPPPNVISSSFPLSSDLEECGKEMVKKCGGLPLAIIVLGGLLQSKKSLSEWESVSKKIGIRSHEDRVGSILSMSYHELPFHLKPLFLYLGLFPEDANISVKKLVHMWIAERLVKEREGETLEEVGRQYLDELVHKCMVQIGEKSVGGRTKTCRLHDKMRALCIDIGKRENFFEVITGENRDPPSLSSSPSSKLWRCKIYIDKDNQYVFPKHLTPCLLKHFIVNLVCLQTINLRSTYITDSMSNTMSNVLHQLKHLYGYRIELSKINNMRKIQTLCNARAGPWITDLVKLTNLEKLGVMFLNEETMGLLTDAIVDGGLDKLRSLYIDGDEFSSDLMEALSGKRRLLKLRLCGRIKKLPSQLPTNLIKLKLQYAYHPQDPMPTLEKLQHLLFLRLEVSYKGKEMVCSSKGFPRLQHLAVINLWQLEEWTVEEGAMPCLTTCVIEYCRNFKMVPQGFKFLTMLQELTIKQMPYSFEKRVKEGGEDWETIQHIPSITVTESLNQ
ncbi:hypothetical protein AQUCO_06300003v1 [Aquilegia coerulea]|uniref:NB-ARC domain-containing protein n=1 Tax=Aquilegia coerulea TaxID=218851 RepID=A0A2G5CCS0_AQUCA|nr:hypothetical protein AQUCO_06300003v1 [Aquilegia coerulea]